MFKFNGVDVCDLNGTAVIGPSWLELQFNGQWSSLRCKRDWKLQLESDFFLHRTLWNWEPWCFCITLFIIKTWVNIFSLSRSVEEVCEALQRAGLREANNMADLRESVFCRDPLCSDTLIFSRNLQAQLQDSILCTKHILNIQVDTCKNMLHRHILMLMWRPS